MVEDTEYRKKIIRLMHTYIKVVHHLRGREGNPGLRSLQQEVRWRGYVMLPAAPTMAGGWQLHGNARKWLFEDLAILKTHYFIDPLVYWLLSKRIYGSMDLNIFFNGFMVFFTIPRPGRDLMDRALDLKPEVTQGCGFESQIWQEVL